VAITLPRGSRHGGSKREGGKPGRPVDGGRPSQPQRDEGKAKRQRGLAQPHWNAVGDDVAPGALGEHQFDAGETQQRADDHRHGPGEETRQQRAAADEQRVERGQRKQALLARGHRGPQHAGDQREVLGEGSRTRDADPEERP